jgi:drug/metabolite transporter superfamily protein YnfA
MSILLLLVLIVVVVAILPTWPHSNAWGWGPSGVGGVLLVLFVVWLLFFGGLRHFH